MKKRTAGFTIVELLIVIVVIGILAAITIVAYSGVQERARYATYQQDISAVNKAILMYYAEKGVYPNNGTSAGSVTNLASIPGGFSEYMAKTPVMKADSLGSYYAYIWSNGGVDYKLVRLITGTTPQVPLPKAEQSNPGLDPNRVGRGWGIWSSGGANI